MSTSWSLIISLFLLIGNALAVAAEFAVVSARRTLLEQQANEGSRRAKTALFANEHATMMLATSQLAITLCSLGLGALAEPAIGHAIEGWFHVVLSEGQAAAIGFAVALIIVVYLHIILGEMVPKNLALAAPDTAAKALAPMLIFITRVFRPFIWLTNGAANGILRLFKVEQQDEVASTFSAEEVADLVSESRREGLLDQDEHELLTGALGFEEGIVTSVLLPLDSLVTVGDDVTPAQVEEVCVQTGYSRFPVLHDTGELAGYLHLKDVLETEPEKRDRPIAAKWIRPMASVGTGESLRNVLSTMQRKGSHMARVVRPDGEVLGVVALEDVLEKLVGEVRDATQTVTD